MTDRTQPALRLLLRLEARLLLRSPAAWIVLVVCGAATVVAVANGVSMRNALQRAADEATREQRALHATVRNELARKPAAPTALQPKIAPFRAALPPLPSAVVSVGAADVLPQRYAYRSGERFFPFVRTGGSRILSGLFVERPTENPSGLVLGRFDMTFVVIYVFPLAIVILTFNLASADREGGTLALVLSNSISFRRWLGARVATRAILFAVTFTIVPLCAILVTTQATSAAALVPRLVFWSVACVAYYALWFALAILLNARGSSSAFNALVLTGAWLMLVVIIPAGVSLIGRGVVSPASTFAFVVAERAASLEINPRIDAATAVLARAASSAIAPPSRRYRALVEERRQLFQEQLAPVVDALDREERRQERVVSVLRLLSPVLLVQQALDEVAGTGTDRWRRFVSQLDAYIRERDAFFTARITSDTQITTADVDQQLAPFAFREEHPTELLARLVTPLATLSVFAAVALGLAFTFTRS